MKQAVLSLSGGMDSTSLLIHLLANGYQVKAYSFDYGQRHKLELERLKANIEYLQSKDQPVAWGVIDLKSVFSDSTSSLLPQSGIEVPTGHYADETMKGTVIENRNAIFSSAIYSKALAWANKTEKDVQICLGTHSGDHAIYPDCRPEFHEALDYAFKIGNWGSERVSSYLPYLYGDKFSILQDCWSCCVRLDIDFMTVLSNTNTCYQPNENGESCGKCGSCVERLEAFEKLGMTDPVQYAE